MEILTIEELQALAEQSRNPSISIFLPTHRARPETQQDPIRFKNLLRQAERQLLDSGMGPRELEKLLQPAQDLLDTATFWLFSYDGLAVFLADGDFHTFRLPFRVEELVTVGSSYYVKPLLPLFTNNGHFYLLAISQNEVRLFEGTRHSVGQIDLPEALPRSLEDTLPEGTPERMLQYHTGTQSGGRSAIFHGHGAGEEDQKVRIERYLNVVDAGVRPLLRGQRTPLVLAGVDYLLPLYRKVSEYGDIVEEGVTGNPERMSPEDLHERAWGLVEPRFHRETEDALAQFRQLAGTGRVTDRIDEVVQAARQGRVDRLVLSPDTPVWGALDRDSGQVLHHAAERTLADDVALADFAATQTLRNGGTVYAVQREMMPTDSPAVAILRY